MCIIKIINESVVFRKIINESVVYRKCEDCKSFQTIATITIAVTNMSAPSLGRRRSVGLLLMLLLGVLTFVSTVLALYIPSALCTVC